MYNIIENSVSAKALDNDTTTHVANKTFITRNDFYYADNCISNDIFVYRYPKLSKIISIHMKTVNIENYDMFYIQMFCKINLALYFKTKN